MRRSSAFCSFLPPCASSATGTGGQVVAKAPSPTEHSVLPERTVEGRSGYRSSEARAVSKGRPETRQGPLFSYLNALQGRLTFWCGKRGKPCRWRNGVRPAFELQAHVVGQVPLAASHHHRCDE